jgi:bifunctional non-homologous end joining protein LigD
LRKPCPQWAHEIKHDGYRFICRRDGDRVRVFSRSARDWSDRVPLIVEAMRALPVASATIDGEGVMVDDRGVTDFERLRVALAERGGSRAAFLYGFDLLEIDSEDLHWYPWEIRRARLTRLLRKAGPGVRLSEHLDGDGETIFRHACALGAEGIVAKRRDRPLSLRTVRRLGEGPIKRSGLTYLLRLMLLFTIIAGCGCLDSGFACLERWGGL